MKTPKHLQGQIAVTFLEWLTKLLSEYINVPDMILFVDRVLKLYSQPFQEAMIIKPDEPNYLDYQKYQLSLMKWNNWQPLFKTEGVFFIDKINDDLCFGHNDVLQTICKLSSIKTLDDFIRECKGKIELIWNIK